MLLASSMALEHESDSALARAVRVAKSQSAFGRLIGKPQSTISFWLSQRRALPGDYVLTVERQTGISRHDLRPDLYPREEVEAATGMEPAQ